jgi:hypothetical protein
MRRPRILVVHPEPGLAAVFFPVAVPVPERGIHPAGRRSVAGAGGVSAGLGRGRHSCGLKSAFRGKSRPT